ncbi:MAG: DUF3237 domain-containing protein [Acidimicrobiia bacterium]
MPIELVALCTATARLADAFILPDTPAGTRAIAEVTAFDLVGDRLTGHLMGNAAADWLTVDSRGQGTLDVRALIETHDGALVFANYRGRLDLAGGTGAAPVYSAPLFDTGDERYLWLNRIQAVAKGTVSDGGRTLVYEMYELR